MKFQLNNKWYIRSLDERNWIIAQTITPTRKSSSHTTQQERKDYERVFGYYPTLQWAKEGAVELIAKESETIEELERAVKLIKSIEI